MKTLEKQFKWNEGEAKVFFNVEAGSTRAEAANIRIEKTSAAIELPEFPIIVENADGKQIFRADRLNKNEGHSFEYFDNKYSKEILAYIDAAVKRHK